MSAQPFEEKITDIFLTGATWLSDRMDHYHNKKRLGIILNDAVCILLAGGNDNFINEDKFDLIQNEVRNMFEIANDSRFGKNISWGDWAEIMIEATEKAEEKAFHSDDVIMLERFREGYLKPLLSASQDLPNNGLFSLRLLNGLSHTPAEFLAKQMNAIGAANLKSKCGIENIALHAYRRQPVSRP